MRTRVRLAVSSTLLALAAGACFGDLPPPSETGSTSAGGSGGDSGAGAGGAAGNDGGSGGGSDSGSDAGGGTGGSDSCSLSIVNSGELPQLQPGHADASGPAVVATPQGFIAMYRSYESGDLWANAFRIGETGAGPATRTRLDACPMYTPADGTGLVWHELSGVAAMTVPDCGLGSGAGVIFFRVGIDAGLEGSKIRNPEFLELSLSAKALAVTNVAGASEFVYRARTGLGSDLQRAVLQENAFASGITPTPMLFNGAEGDYVAVAGTDQIRAFIAPVSSVEQIVVQISSPLEAIDSTGGVNKGQLITLPIGGPVTATAWDDRVAVATTTAGELTWLIANTDREVVARDTLPGVTAISSAALNDHLFIAGASTSRIRIARVDGVRGADPSFAQAVELEPEQLPTLNDYTGQWIATAAGANRVALLWLAHNPDAPTSAPGGWALLECQN